MIKLLEVGYNFLKLSLAQSSYTLIAEETLFTAAVAITGTG